MGEDEIQPTNKLGFDKKKTLDSSPARVQTSSSLGIWPLEISPGFLNHFSKVSSNDDSLLSFPEVKFLIGWQSWCHHSGGGMIA